MISENKGSMQVQKSDFLLRYYVLDIARDLVWFR